MKYILHIGRSKTGTSSLQMFLYTNRGVIDRYGFYYPKSGLSKIAHHDIARYFANKVRSACLKSELLQMKNLLKEFSEEISNKNQIILLSSENFQNCDPELLLEVFEPENTKIVVYLREQVDYFISSYQQRVHAKNEYASLDEAVSRYKGDYDSFLRRWERVFGKENIEVRVYDRCQLFRGDIIHDFMNFLGVKITDDFIISPLDRNPSIGGALLEFKRILNAFGIDQALNLELYRILSSIAVDEPHYRLKPILASELATTIRERVGVSNQHVFKRYFNGENMFAAACGREETNNKKNISPPDLFHVLGKIKKMNEEIFDNIVTELLLPSQRQQFDIQLKQYLAACENGFLSDELMLILHESVDARLRRVGKFLWNYFSSE